MSSEVQTTVTPTHPPPIGNYPEGAEVKTYKGGCHCHKFTFDFRHPSLDVKKPISCNCTFCTRTGGINIFGPENFFHLDGSPTSWDEIGKFKAKTKPITHHFCPHCGCWMFWVGVGLVGVNIRMFEGIELENLSIDHYDGKSKS